ncbi:dihydroorotate dehydrogenase electron transfer subunit [Fuerstiella marisgermanici]|uniref:Dihydroorotate oxidase B, electron transfer subunit n=1 Tax=Fuerstiella marisgermanici TaxID=1891926 RepID=A0A1P8WM89_9PLAN|nr:dihydroorotate dehydrogenase electron transfer subunit [Fuerstiella marisgermanici]APZ95166.1 Dihydroorotate oxidase B, electron transfer subunit [Fuerstiella marisgermanici]
MSDTTTDCLPGMMFSAKRHVAMVDTVRQMATDTWAVRIRQPELAKQITPGQFFMVRQPTGSDPLLGRPFALYDIYHDDNEAPAGVEFGFVVVGKLTSLMSGWKAGHEVEVWGPLGNGFPVPTAKHVICVAGGIGQTPFLGVVREALGHQQYGAQARALTHKPESVTLCYGVRSKDYLAGLDDFDVPGLQLEVATDDGSYGHHGFVTALLQECLDKQKQDTQVYCCGPEPMMKAVAELCATESVPCLLSLETPMACGFGACFSCVTKVREDDGSWDYRRTCVEGPVFDAERLVL